MDPIARMVAAGAAGASGSSATYVDDVFSTFLYDGDGSSSRTITNGIDISGEGGLVWVKQRNEARGHNLCDTERGATKILSTHNTSAEGTYTTTITGFTSTGFSVGSDSGLNHSSGEYTSWTFRKAPGFFDIVTYTGTGSAHDISHSLGSEPGMIIYKSINDTREWMVYHRSLGASQGTILNENYAAFSTADFGSGPTSTHFSVGNTAVNNTVGKNYVAYIFAHDDQSFGTNEDEAIIKCGIYTGNASTDGPEIDLGFEPQFLLYKNIDQGTNWEMIDTMRGMPNPSGNYLVPFYMKLLRSNTSGAEGTDLSTYPTPTGFKITNNGASNNATNQYIYMAIRRPHKPPTAGTEVFKAIARTGTSSNVSVTGVGFSPDSHFSKIRSSGNTYQNLWFDKLRGPGTYTKPAATAAENTSSNIHLSFDQDGVTFGNGNNANGSSLDYINYFFKRSPGFFDVVGYTGTGSNQTVNHNLGVVPELIIIKKRSAINYWHVFVDGVTSPNSNWYQNFGSLNTDSAFAGFAGAFSSAPTSTALPLGSGTNVGASGADYIGYLFGTLSGISKVGIYSGTGSSVNVDCGFTAGARFVLIKRTDSTSNWFVFDTVRGITSTSSPWIALNLTIEEQTGSGNNFIDPYSSGFTVDTSISALNAIGGTYVFLAIA